MFRVCQRVITTINGHHEHGAVIGTCADMGGNTPDCWALLLDSGEIEHAPESLMIAEA